jgi:hypothetical protein
MDNYSGFEKRKKKFIREIRKRNFLTDFFFFFGTNCLAFGAVVLALFLIFMFWYR